MSGPLPCRAAPPDPAFEAASIRLNTSGNNGKLTMTPGRITFTSVTLEECILAAYDIRTYQLGGPALLTAARYDITAAAEGPASTVELKAMLKTLLLDRFKLSVHTESRELPAYFLIRTKKDPRLTPAGAGEKAGYALDAGAVIFHATSMQAFADYLSRRGPIDRPVLDRTGIEGAFDFKLALFEARPDMPLDALKRAYYEWDQGTSIFTDLQDQLGLKLQPAKASLDVLVVDSASKPSEN